MCGDRRVRVRFEPCPEGGLLMTADVALQQAVERDADYGVVFSLVQQKPEPEVSGAEVSELTPVEEVRNISDAKGWLMRNGVPHQGLRTPENILKRAEEQGVWFPNLKLGE